MSNRMKIIREAWNNLNPTIKRYVISSVHTFLSVFSVSLIASIDIALNSSEITMTKGFWFSLISSALVTAVRAVVKSLSESMTKTSVDLK